MIDEKDKITKVYKTYMTPIGKLLSIPHAENYLKDGITKESLLAQARQQSHLVAAQEMQAAKHQLFKLISAQTML